MLEGPHRCPDGVFVWRGRFTPIIGADGWDLPRVSLDLQLEGNTELVILDSYSFPWESLRVEHLDRPITIVMGDSEREIVKGAAGRLKWYLFHTAADQTFDTVEQAVASLDRRQYPVSAEHRVRKAADHALLQVIRQELETAAHELMVDGLAVKIAGPGGREWISPVRHMEHTKDVEELDPATDLVRDGAVIPAPVHVAVTRLDSSLSGEEGRQLLQDSWEVLGTGMYWIVVAHLSRDDDDGGSPLEALLDDVMFASGSAANIEEFKMLRLPHESFGETVMIRYCKIEYQWDTERQS